MSFQRKSSSIGGKTKTAEHALLSYSFVLRARALVPTPGLRPGAASVRLTYRVSQISSAMWVTASVSTSTGRSMNDDAARARAR